MYSWHFNIMILQYHAYDVVRHIVLLPRDRSLKVERIFSYLTLQSLQQGPVAHSASVVSLQVIGSQQGSYSLHSSIDPQSHCSPSSITLFPHDLLISNYKRKQIPNRLQKHWSNLLHGSFDSLLIRSKCYWSCVSFRFTSFGLLKRQMPWPLFKASI